MHDDIYDSVDDKLLPFPHKVVPEYPVLLYQCWQYFNLFSHNHRARCHSLVNINLQLCDLLETRCDLSMVWFYTLCFIF